jgi:hypothetical protein
MCGLDASGSELVLLAGSCEHGNKLSGYVNLRECFDLQNGHQILKKDSVPWS